MADPIFAEIRDEASLSDGYQAMSGLAVAGFIGGLLSAAALAGAVMWFVPGLAIVVCIAALRQTSTAARKGAGLARAGLALAVMFLTAGISYGWWQDYIIRAQAQRVADRWVEAVLAGDVRLAHQLTLEPTFSLETSFAVGTARLARHAGADGLDDLYSQEAALAEGLQQYGKDPLVAKVAEVGRVKGTVASRQVTFQETDSFKQMVSFRYELEYEENGHRETLPVALTLSRPLRFAPKIAGWKVSPLGHAVAGAPAGQ